MIANYGYKDGSGVYYIRIDTDLCDGCADCQKACPEGVLEIVDEDPNDPLRDDPVAVVAERERKKIKYTCAPCKPSGQSTKLPCVTACKEGAISHSW